MVLRSPVTPADTIPLSGFRPKPTGAVAPIQPAIVKPSAPMSLQLNDLIAPTPGFGNTGINPSYSPGYDDIAKSLTLAQGLDNSPAPTGSSAGIASPASVVNGEVKVQTQTQGEGIFNDVLGVLGNVLGQVLTAKAGQVASQGGAKVIPVGGGVSVVSVPVQGNNATQPVDKTVVPGGVSPMVLIFGGLVALFLLKK